MFENDTINAEVVYEAPEAVEIGSVEELTLGYYGCAPDGPDCHYDPTAPVF